MIDKSQEIHFWNLSSLNYLTATVDAIDRIYNKQNLNQNDYFLRDMYFTGQMNLQNRKQKQNFISKAIYFLKDLKVYDKLAFYQSLSFQNTLKKYNFWKKILKMRADSKEKVQCRNVVSKIVWSYRMLPLLLFGAATMFIFKITGVSKLQHQKYLFGLLGCCWLVNIIIQYRKSDEIFYKISPLAIQELQQQRKSIINQSIVLDGKINDSLKLQPISKELLEIANKQKKLTQQKLILEAAGFKIISCQIQ